MVEGWGLGYNESFTARCNVPTTAALTFNGCLLFLRRRNAISQRAGRLQTMADLNPESRALFITADKSSLSPASCNVKLISNLQ